MVKWNRRGWLAVSLLLLAAPAARAVVSGQCVKARGGNSCTANDITFVLVGLGNQNDGCVNSSDTLTLRLGAKVANTTANTRYDIGMYIYDYLGTEPGSNPAASVGYAYNGSDCARETLRPVGTASPAQTCTSSPPLNLLGGSGPFLNADSNSDSCGDLKKDAACGDSFMVFSSPITVKCSDGLAGTATDGFVDIPTCATWGNSANEVPSGGSNCTSETDVLPGTPSKCNCANINSTVPAPSLSLSCSCSPTAVRVGAGNGVSTACTVTFSNSVSCSPDSSTAERFRCGAASFLQFDTVAETPNGSYIFGQTQGNAPTETTGGAIDAAAAGTIRWTPRDTVATGGGTTLGVLGHNETGTLSFQYYVDPSVPSNTTINFNTTAYWSDSSSFGSRIAQSALTAACSITTSDSATWANVTDVGLTDEEGGVALRWQTSAEVGTVAFDVERLDPASGGFVRLDERPLPAVGQLPGGRYRFVDPGAPRGAALTYRIIEITASGARTKFGPYRLEPGPAAEGGVDREQGPRAKRGAEVTRTEIYRAEGRPASARLLRAAATSSLSSQADPAPDRAKAVAAAPRRAKVWVAARGLQRLRSADLASALGLSAEAAAAQVRSGRLRLSSGDQEVAWQPAGDGSGLVFFGEPLHNAYTDRGVYWLEVGRGSTIASLPTAAAGGPAATTFLDSLHLEIDAIPAIIAPIPVDDYWIWKGFFPGYPGFDRATFAVDVPGPGAGAATLTVHLYGFAATQSASLSLNGRSLGELRWSGTGPADRTVAVPDGALQDGANQLELTVLEGERGFWLDSFDLAYPRLYRALGDRLGFQAAAGSSVAVAGFRGADVAVYSLAQPLAPRRIDGVQVQPQPDGSWAVRFVATDGGPYFAASSSGLLGTVVQASAPLDLRNPSLGATYLVIAPRDLRAEAQRLADLRSAQGLSALVVDLEDIMDLFGGGLSDPAAIRSFLSFAVRSWATPPRYVALAGKGSYDYRNLLGLSSNRIPPLLLATETGLAPADSQFGDFAGSGIPALAIGRIPAVTVAELGAYVDKVAAYEADPGGAWTKQVLMLADDADPAGDFAASSRALSSTLPGGLALTQIAVDPSQVALGRSQLQAALRQGQVLMSYVGHGGLDRLTAEGVLQTADVAQLGNAPRLPVLSALTCLISEFAYPTFTSVGEEMTLRADGGAIAVYGPTWLSYNAQATVLGGYLLPQLAAPGGGRLGDRLQRALSAYAAAGGDRQMLRFYTLLGDPALALKR